MREAQTDRQSWADDCQLRAQGRQGGTCHVEVGEGLGPACKVTLRKRDGDLERLIETNGWGLTPKNLDLLQEAGVDSFWLDIKAYDDEAHTWLTGCTNRWILGLPQEILQRRFVLEVLSLYIPGLVETDQLRRLAELVASAGHDVPFTILAFFPEYRMRAFRAPNLDEMLAAYRAARAAGLEHVRLGNIGVFARTETQVERLLEATGGLAEGGTSDEG